MIKKLNRRQQGLIEELFAGRLDEQQVLEKYNISRNLYSKWLTEGCFCRELALRVKAARLQSEMLIAKYSLAAAAKLVSLTESDKPETARKACLDIISLKAASIPADMADSDKEAQTADSDADQLSPDTAAKMLAVLAEEKNNQKNIDSKPAPLYHSG